MNPKKSFQIFISGCIEYAEKDATAKIDTMVAELSLLRSDLGNFDMEKAGQLNKMLLEIQFCGELLRNHRRDQDEILEVLSIQKKDASAHTEDERKIVPVYDSSFDGLVKAFKLFGYSESLATQLTEHHSNMAMSAFSHGTETATKEIMKYVFLLDEGACRLTRRLRTK